MSDGALWLYRKKYCSFALAKNIKGKKIPKLKALIKQQLNILFKLLEFHQRCKMNEIELHNLVVQYSQERIVNGGRSLLTRVSFAK